VKIAPSNTYVDGQRWPAGWIFDLSASATKDDGPSPAGNPGPYLHADKIGSDTRHRLYPREAALPVFRSGVWEWELL
jgi:hypothetical protein